ncbi:multinuclear nonheme iron-dependent oxidase [Streptomyces sp. NBC_01294]|uniref:multinuclear nonheme iron-dependent oxidase n=1 Tax=Streptomyces sp. NBC_01294 TaxID=2903815 RepID=UPI002DD98972|nr:DUF692 family multinuclear iron-containing protein [Streptomyces sp. NBC_01294]WRZ62316.1 DUF692 domain-containing protein [Streptomyces sp. NBC_01294]
MEVNAESLPHGQLPVSLPGIRARGTSVVPHGVSLSLGGAQRPDAHRLAHLAHCAEAVGAPLVSEHLAFVCADGLEAGHLQRSRAGTRPRPARPAGRGPRAGSRSGRGSGPRGGPWRGGRTGAGTSAACAAARPRRRAGTSPAAA